MVFNLTAAPRLVALPYILLGHYTKVVEPFKGFQAATLAGHLAVAHALNDMARRRYVVLNLQERKAVAQAHYLRLLQVQRYAQWL